MNTDKQMQNLHTLDQIKADGNAILSRAGDETLVTKRGETVTQWYEKEPGYWYPFNSFNRSY